MKKMRVIYQTLRGVNGDPTISTPAIVCLDAFDCKDILKGMGFKWNSIEKSWVKMTSDNSFMTEFVNVVVACEMTYEDVERAMPFIPESVLTINPDEDSLKAYNDYMDAHPEWF